MMHCFHARSLHAILAPTRANELPWGHSGVGKGRMLAWVADVDRVQPNL